MSKTSICPCTETCPMQKATMILGGKWKIPLICSLAMDGPTRYNDLRRRMGGISNTMLAKSLKELEESGLILRRAYLETPVRVEYELTDRAKELVPILTDIAKWAMMLD